MTRDESKKRIVAAGIIPIVRVPTSDDALRVVDAILAAGIDLAIVSAQGYGSILGRISPPSVHVHRSQFKLQYHGRLPGIRQSGPLRLLRDQRLRVLHSLFQGSSFRSLHGRGRGRDAHFRDPDQLPFLEAQGWILCAGQLRSDQAV